MTSALRSDATEFAGKRVLVTGGTRGIGAAIVERGEPARRRGRTADIAHQQVDAAEAVVHRFHHPRHAPRIAHIGRDEHSRRRRVRNGARG